MSKTIGLRTELLKKLKATIENSHYATAPDTAQYPYLVYELKEIAYKDGKNLLELEVNITDYGTDTRIVEDIADELQEELHKYYFINNKIQFVSYRGLRNIIEEKDKQIIRRRLTFEIHLHELKGE